MKLLTIVIPSYNSEKFLASCLDSLLVGLDDKLEVFVVNDGSKDKTSEIAHKYEKEHNFIKVIDKENGGHGSAVNVTIPLATGLYYKILDSDDHLSKDGLFELIEDIENKQKENNLPDVYLADYLSVSILKNKTTTISLKKYFPRLKAVVKADEIKKIPSSSFIMLHAVFAKTKMLQDSNLNLLEHTFYEDNQYVYHVCLNALTYCHLEKPIYLYSVGFSDQSISLANMQKNYSHQLRVLAKSVEMIDDEHFLRLTKGQQNLAATVLTTISYLSYFYSYIGKNKEAHKEYKTVFKYFKTTNKKIYRKIKYKFMIALMNSVLPFLRRFVCVFVYRVGAKKRGWTF